MLASSPPFYISFLLPLLPVVLLLTCIIISFTSQSVSSLLVFCSSYFFSSYLHNGFCCLLFSVRSFWASLFCWKHLNTFSTKAPDKKMKPTLLTMRIFDNNCCTLSTSGSAEGLHCCTITNDTSSLSLPVFFLLSPSFMTSCMTQILLRSFFQSPVAPSHACLIMEFGTLLPF